MYKKFEIFNLIFTLAKYQLVIAIPLYNALLFDDPLTIFR